MTRVRPCITTASDALPKPARLFHDALGLLGELFALGFRLALRRRRRSIFRWAMKQKSGIFENFTAKLPNKLSDLFEIYLIYTEQRRPNPNGALRLKQTQNQVRQDQKG